MKKSTSGPYITEYVGRHRTSGVPLHICAIDFDQRLVRIGEVNARGMSEWLNETQAKAQYSYEWPPPAAAMSWHQFVYPATPSSPSGQFNNTCPECSFTDDHAEWCGGGAPPTVRAPAAPAKCDCGSAPADPTHYDWCTTRKGKP